MTFDKFATTVASRRVASLKVGLAPPSAAFIRLTRSSAQVRADWNTADEDAATEDNHTEEEKVVWFFSLILEVVITILAKCDAIHSIVWLCLL